MAGAQLIPIFPVPIYLERPSRGGALNRPLASAIRAIHTADTHGKQLCAEKYSGGYTSYFTHRRLELDPRFVSFTNMILDCAREFTEKLGFESKTALRMVNLWTNINSRGGYHEKHRHENSFLSGTYYVEAGEGAAPITFYDPKAAFRMIEPHMDNPATFTAKVFSVQPTTGTLVLFPSYLEHKVEVQKSDLDRLSLSFNIIFTAKNDFD